MTLSHKIMRLCTNKLRTAQKLQKLQSTAMMCAQPYNHASVYAHCSYTYIHTSLPNLHPGIGGSGDTCCVVLGNCCFVPHAWCLVFGAWCLVSGPFFDGVGGNAAVEAA